MIDWNGSIWDWDWDWDWDWTWTGTGTGTGTGLGLGLRKEGEWKEFWDGGEEVRKLFTCKTWHWVNEVG